MSALIGDYEPCRIHAPTAHRSKTTRTVIATQSGKSIAPPDTILSRELRLYSRRSIGKCRRGLLFGRAVSSGQNQWEETKRKGRRQRHAYGEREGQCQNCGYLFHGSVPFLAMWRLPEQRKDIRDRHHVLELFESQGRGTTRE